MPRSLARLSASESSHRDLSSAVFITNIAESDFRYTQVFGIRDKPIAPASPWQNAFAERLIGSIRRECVDHIIVFSEAQLRRILTKYALNKDAPFHRAIQRLGAITSQPRRTS